MCAHLCVRAAPIRIVVIPVRVALPAVLGPLHLHKQQRNSLAATLRVLAAEDAPSTSLPEQAGSERRLGSQQGKQAHHTPSFPVLNSLQSLCQGIAAAAAAALRFWKPLQQQPAERKRKMCKCSPLCGL